ncbi:MAG: hypothetical protein KJ587_02090 [Alphaproteobacteria bacterium]|nr:hypothetical protein [Alphaproteobacteria bacterium]
MIRTSSALASSALLSCFCAGTAGAADLKGSTCGARLKVSYAAEPTSNLRRSLCLRLDDLHAHEVKFGLRHDRS